jgi:hypothetical protein
LLFNSDDLESYRRDKNGNQLSQEQLAEERLLQKAAYERY